MNISLDISFLIAPVFYPLKFSKHVKHNCRLIDNTYKHINIRGVFKNWNFDFLKINAFIRPHQRYPFPNSPQEMHTYNSSFCILETVLEIHRLDSF